MSTKNIDRYPNTAAKTRVSRAERRAAERAAARQLRARQKRQLPWPGILGGAVTIAAVLVIVLSAVLRTNASQSSAGLTDPKALNPASSLLQPGTMAPDFVLRNVNGTPYHLAAQRGHPIVLEFFAIWCPHCQAEAPVIARVTKQYAARGVQVWSILANPYGRSYESSGGTDLRLADKSDLTWFARKYDVRHPQLVDPKFTVVNEYGASAYPGLYVIDGTGRIVYSGSGERSYPLLARSIDTALRS